jgi:hypothetical protein
MVGAGGLGGGEGGLRGWSERPVWAAALGGQSGDGEHEEENVKGKPSTLRSQRI